MMLVCIVFHLSNLLLRALFYFALVNLKLILNAIKTNKTSLYLPLGEQIQIFYTYPHCMRIGKSHKIYLYFA